MYGLDLFSGYGGITEALSGYVRPVAYCEIERYAQGILLSRMLKGQIPFAPIWDDVNTLKGSMLPPIDIIYGGFPCQDISVAGRGEGLDGKRSGLFFEIARLVSEIRPRFVFLENVSAITNRGSSRVVGELVSLGYDCRWGVLSASDVGANHERARWWMLAHSNSAGLQETRTKLETTGIEQQSLLENPGRKLLKRTIEQGTISMENGKQYADKFERSGEVFHTKCQRLSRQGTLGDASDSQKNGEGETDKSVNASFRSFWISEPNVGRVVNGTPFRSDRLRAIGNGVVPAQAREAFERLMGIK